MQLDEPIKLKCSTDENLRISSIKWYRNGHRITEENNPNVQIERIAANDYIHSTLTIRKSTPSDAGSYMCKFDKLHEKIHVDVVIGLKGASSGNIFSSNFNLFMETFSFKNFFSFKR